MCANFVLASTWYSFEVISYLLGTILCAIPSHLRNMEVEYIAHCLHEVYVVCCWT